MPKRMFMQNPCAGDRANCGYSRYLDYGDAGDYHGRPEQFRRALK